MLAHLLMICALASPSIIDRALWVEFDALGKQTVENGPFRCSQPAAEQAAKIREAEAHDYTIRRLEFLGNERISDWVLRKRMRALQEGEKFRRNNIVRSLANVSRLKTIYPVRFSDVVVRLEESDKLVDMVICLTEKHRAKK
jgi:outer membrane protein assembly factor BamA